MLLKFAGYLILTAALALLGTGALAAEQPQEWEMLIPAGEVEKTFIEPAARITGLEGKTVVLRWNGKNNGDVLLDRLAELLKEKHPKAKIVKSYEIDKTLNNSSSNPENSARITKAILDMKPDLVIASQAD